MERQKTNWTEGIEVAFLMGPPRLPKCVSKYRSPTFALERRVGPAERAAREETARVRGRPTWDGWFFVSRSAWRSKYDRPLLVLLSQRSNIIRAKGGQP